MGLGGSCGLDEPPLRGGAVSLGTGQDLQGDFEGLQFQNPIEVLTGVTC